MLDAIGHACYVVTFVSPLPVFTGSAYALRRRRPSIRYTVVGCFALAVGVPLRWIALAISFKLCFGLALGVDEAALSDVLPDVLEGVAVGALHGVLEVGILWMDGRRRK